MSWLMHALPFQIQHMGGRLESRVPKTIENQRFPWFLIKAVRSGSSRQPFFKKTKPMYCSKNDFLNLVGASPKMMCSERAIGLNFVLVSKSRVLQQCLVKVQQFREQR
jgi:hypothetical protein